MIKSINKNNTIKISVRNLVEFVLRSGDIDNRKGGISDIDAMNEGSKLHRRIQKRMGSNYQAEVALKVQIPYEDIVIEVDGRADGIIDGDIITIDEIKSIRKGIEYIDEPVFLHKAQAMCYAYMYASKHDNEKIRVRITYGNYETDATKIFEEEFAMDYLKKWFMEVVDEYYKWAKHIHDSKILTMVTAKALEFPYEYRKGQREVAVNVYKAFSRKINLYVQAPTGIGKTLATIFPAVKSFGEGICDKIFYLTAKTIAGSVAKDSYNILRNAGLHISTVTITAKEKMCVKDETKCNPDYCERAKGHFDRINDAIFDVITSETDITREKILEYASKHNVCPFEMNLDISNFCDGIICDYNYAFDPSAKLKRYFGESVNGDYIFLVDEAHNMIDRAREMYSAILYKDKILEVKKIFLDKDKGLVTQLDKMNKAMLHYKRQCLNGFSVLFEIEKLVMPVLRFTERFEKYIEEHGEFDNKDKAMELYFEAKTFINVFEIMDDNYEMYSEIQDDGNFRIKLFCINPSVRLGECLAKNVSTIFFSATLLPVNYYKSLITGEIEDYAVYVESPFPKENRVIAIGDDVTSKYTMRGKILYERIADYINKVLETKMGNYMVFFPSYKMLNDVLEAFSEKYVNENNEDIEVIVQDSSMKEADRERFLSRFEEIKDGALLGFCVMGGIFSEGIDLKKDKLIGTIVVGTGLPQVCNERELISAYFNEREMNGFDYSYKIPGMNKVMQAAGRVIRTMEDKGIILLLDNRFKEYSYRQMFPKEWDDVCYVNVNNVKDVLSKIWTDKEDR